MRRVLIESGLWTALRQRPFSRVPEIGFRPKSIFVTAIDTNPLAAEPAVVIQTRPADFIAGLEVLSTLTDGPLHVCHARGVTLPGAERNIANFQSFSGPHPAGLVGTHIHFLSPVSAMSAAYQNKNIAKQICMRVGGGGHFFGPIYDLTCGQCHSFGKRDRQSI